MSSDQAGRIGWGVIGTGHIASVFFRDLALLPEEADLVAAGSRNLDRAQTFADEHGLRRAYGSYAELVADPDIDVVYVATPHSDHLASARLCLEAGKSVLVEKPLTVSAPDTAALIDLARERGTFLMEAVWMRTTPLIRHAAEVVARGEIGTVRHLSADFGFTFDGPASHRLLDPDQGGGAILDLGVYPVHAAQLFLGEPTEVSGTGETMANGVDLHAAALLSHAGGTGQPAVTATVVCSLATTLPTRLAILGTEGRILIDEFYLRPAEIKIYRSIDAKAEPEVLVTQWPGGGYTFQAQEVMRCLRGGELESPLVPWADTLAVARTLERWRATLPVPGKVSP